MKMCPARLLDSSSAEGWTTLANAGESKRAARMFVPLPKILQPDRPSITPLFRQLSCLHQQTVRHANTRERVDLRSPCFSSDTNES